jgi:hypothetical protein
MGTDYSQRPPAASGEGEHASPLLTTNAVLLIAGCFALLGIALVVMVELDGGWLLVALALFLALAGSGVDQAVHSYRSS